MILWAIQPASIYYQIQREGYYHYDESRSEDNESIYEFRMAYDWLAGEMCKRIGPPPKGVKYPVWAWYVHNSRRRKPDLRKGSFIQATFWELKAEQIRKVQFFKAR